jgi:hypothetical protein
MPQPNNYILNVPDPTDAIMKSIAVGQTMRTAHIQNQQVEITRKRNEALQTAIAGLGPGATADQYAAVANKLALVNPDMAKQLMANFDVLTADQKNSKLEQAQQIFVALRNDPKVAVQMMTDLATAYRESGDEKNAKAMDDWIKIAEISPDAAASASGAMLGALDKDALQGALDLIKVPVEVAKAQAEAEKLKVETDNAIEAEKRAKGLAPLIEAEKKADTKLALAQAEEAKAKAANPEGKTLSAADKELKDEIYSRYTPEIAKNVWASHLVNDKDIENSRKIYNDVLAQESGSSILAGKTATPKNKAEAARQSGWSPIYGMTYPEMIWSIDEKVKSGKLSIEKAAEYIAIANNHWGSTVIDGKEQSNIARETLEYFSAEGK